MKTLELNRMEGIEGGGIIGGMGSGSPSSCLGAALGLFGLGVAIATTPVTGGLSVALFAGTMAGAFGTGISLADCL